MINAINLNTIDGRRILLGTKEKLVASFAMVIVYANIRTRMLQKLESPLINLRDV
jgi:hypothetical protein